MPARDMVCVTNGSMGKVVLCLNISEETETSVLFSVSLQAHQRKLFFSLEGTGPEESGRRWQPCLVPAEMSGEAGGSGQKWALTSPSQQENTSPVLQGQQPVAVAASAWQKQKVPGLVRSVCPPNSPSLGSVGPASAQARVVLVGRMVSLSVCKMKMPQVYQCSAHTGCDCCCASTSGNSAGAWLSSASDNEKRDWSC